MAIGVDIVDVERIKNLKKREQFIEKICTNYEKHYINSKKKKWETLAGMFAAKEAMMKALKVGIGHYSFKDFEIKHTKEGAPMGFLKSENYSFHLSISHDGGLAIAVALLKEENCGIEIIKPRKSDSHKGSYGKIGLIGGSKGMAGSIYLSSLAALRTGSGLVYTLVPEKLSEILQIKSVENIIHSIGNGDFLGKESADEILRIIKDYDAVGIGPGFSRYDGQEILLKDIILRFRKPIVIDADGLFHLKKILNQIPTKHLILTPHLKEFSSLIGIPLEKIMGDPMFYGQDFMKNFEGVLVLKSHKTQVFSKEEHFTNEFGNPGMATAGSGDVLTGVITSFLGQGFSPIEAATMGVTFHSLAGDAAARELGEYSLIARDIIKYLPKVLQ